jgi:hypothetical protein
VQRDVDQDVVASATGKRFANSVEAAEPPGHVRPAPGQQGGVVQRAHPLVELGEDLLPAALVVPGEDGDRPVRRVGRNLPAHRLAGAGVYRAPEPLECGLPARAEGLTDLPPAVPGRPGQVDRRLHGRVRRGQHVSRRPQRIPRRPGPTGPAQFRYEPACRPGDLNGHRMIRAGRTVIDCVNIFMTTIRCQMVVYTMRLQPVRALPIAPCPVPAPRIAISTPTALTLLQRQRASARPAYPGLRHVGHGPSFSVCLDASRLIIKRGYSSLREIADHARRPGATASSGPIVEGRPVPPSLDLEARRAVAACPTLALKLVRN